MSADSSEPVYEVVWPLGSSAYKTRAPAVHNYDLGLSYATERSVAGIAPSVGKLKSSKRFENTTFFSATS